MADINKIKLPSGSTYNIADSAARADIASLQSMLTGAMHYMGITTTALTDGSTTSTISIDGSSKTVGASDAGAVVIYSEKEYVWNGTKWQEFGSTGSLKALAFKDTASGTYTPAGTVAAQTFTGTAATISGTGTYTPDGSVSLTKTNKTVAVSPASSGTATYTPAGSVSVTVTPSTTTVNSITAVGTLPSCTLPVLETSVANETLTLSWTAGSFDAGTLPTKGSNTTVATGITSATGSFSGTGVRLTGSVSTADSASFSGTEGTVSTSASYTPAGTNSSSSLSGTQATITVS